MNQVTTSPAADAIRPIVLDVLCVEPEWFRPEAVLADAPNADSLDVIELQMGIEDALRVEISDPEMADVVTVGDLTVLVERKLNARANP